MLKKEGKIISVNCAAHELISLISKPNIMTMNQTENKERLLNSRLCKSVDAHKIISLTGFDLQLKRL